MCRTTLSDWLVAVGAQSLQIASRRAGVMERKFAIEIVALLELYEKFLPVRVRRHDVVLQSHV
jgi:hypothetical protein